jgi:hypothetical protein
MFMHHLLLLIVLAASAQGVSVGNLTVNYESAPTAVDIDWNPQPRFAWTLAGGEQAAYRLRLFAASSLVWDSGLVTSSQTTQVSYAGPPLQHDQDYAWLVEVTPTGARAVNSSLAVFGTGLDSRAWATGGQWIGGCTGGQASPQLRTSFSLSAQPITRAKAYVTGLGVYTLHLNGGRVGGGRDVLTPGWSTVPTARVLANAYDVAASLVPGQENVVGVRLGQGKYGYVGEFCPSGDATCYAALVHLSITQGSNTTVIATDPASWTCAPSPITFNSLFGGETFNASVDQPGWDAPGFRPTAPWVQAPARSPVVALVSPAPAPIRVMANVTPTDIFAFNTTQPVVSGGRFVMGSPPNIYWVKDNSGTKNLVVTCSPCAAADACGTYVQVSQSYIDSLADGANFTCAMLPATVKTTWIADLGRNMAGFCTFTLPPAAPGSVVSFVHGEIRGPDGSVENTFGASAPPRQCPIGQINCADQLDQYVFGPDGMQGSHTFTPSLTFHGFRYVAIWNWPSGAAAPTPAGITCHQTYTDMADGGSLSFNSSLAVLNSVQAAIVQTQKSNVLGMPSDCPTREKRGWMGDAQVTTRQALLNLDTAAFYENWMRSFSDSLFMSCENDGNMGTEAFSPVPHPFQDAPPRPPNYLCCGHRSEFGCQPGLTPVNATGSLPDVVPFDSISGWPGDWVWQVAGEVIPHAVLVKEANVDELVLLWPYISAHMAFISGVGASSPDGLLHWGPYGDWLGLEKASTGFVENWYYNYAALGSADMAGALNLPQQAAAFTALSASINTAMTKAYFDTGATRWDGGDNANAQAMALAAGLGGAATRAAAPAVAAIMAADAAWNGFHPSGGLASIPWIFEGFRAGNHSELALSMATVEGSPGWAFMATPDMPGTIWEAWTGDATHSDGSKNHPMFTSGIGVWLYESALGLRFGHVLAPPMADEPEDVRREADDALWRSSLAFDPRVRAGLTSEETIALCAVAAKAALRGASTGLEELRAELALAGIPAQRAEPRSMRPVLTAAPDAAVMRAGGSASGWIKVPQGHAEASWAWVPAPAHASSLQLRATVPPGVSGRLALPLALARQVLAEATTGEAQVRVSANGAVLYEATMSLDDGARVCSRLLSGAVDLPPLCIRETELAAPAPGTPHIKVAPRIASWAAVEGAGRIHFAGLAASQTTAASGFIMAEVSWGSFTMEISAL